MFVCVHMFASVCEVQRTTFCVVPQETSTFIFWDKVSSLTGTWSLLNRLGCLADETKDLPVSTSLLLGVQTLTTAVTKVGSVLWTLGVERNIACTEISHCAPTCYSRELGIISQSSGDFQIPGFERNEDRPDWQVVLLCSPHTHSFAGSLQCEAATIKFPLCTHLTQG